MYINLLLVFFSSELSLVMRISILKMMNLRLSYQHSISSSISSSSISSRSSSSSTWFFCKK